VRDDWRDACEVGDIKPARATQLPERDYRDAPF
jgi:hypothetical protein